MKYGWPNSLILIKTGMIAAIILLVISASYLPTGFDIDGNEALSWGEAEAKEPQRVLVIAPHPDDEVLGTGGVIQKHLKRGDTIKIVMMTNGDGQRVNPFASHKYFLELGVRRQQETIKALQQLGLNADNIIFLGYPDRSLDKLWNEYWECEHLYASKYTRIDHSPYADSFTPQAPYCGLAVVRDLEQILEEKPDIIYLPHPNDLHRDHWAANAFVVYAVEELKAQGRLNAAEMLTYLVHYGNWPLPQGRRLDLPLLPPDSLAILDTEWKPVALEAEETWKKYKAILEHKSQVELIGENLMSFARANELFGVVPTLKLRSSIGFLSPPQESEVASEEYSSLKILDPKQRSILANLRGYNDIKAVDIAVKRDFLVVEVKFFDRIRTDNEIIVHIKTLGNGKSYRFTYRAKDLYLNGERISERLTSFQYELSPLSFLLPIPLDLLGRPQELILGVELSRNGTTFGKSAYRLIALE